MPASMQRDRSGRDRASSPFRPAPDCELAGQLFRARSPTRPRLRLGIFSCTLLGKEMNFYNFAPADILGVVFPHYAVGTWDPQVVDFATLYCLGFQSLKNASILIF